MSLSRNEMARWQFDLAWMLMELHLDQLQEADFRWEPAEVCWNVHQSSDGRWLPDWDENELDPIPVPTIAWTTWHIGWWWSVAIDHAAGRTPRDRTEITWPGDGAATIAWLRDLRADWIAVVDRLTDADLDAPAAFPWQYDPEKTVAHMLAWLNVELVKNTSEIGQLRLLRAAKK